TTLPISGQMLQPAHPARLPFPYPAGTSGPTAPTGEMTVQRPSAGSLGMMVVASGQPPRDAPSTAHVPPMAYSNGQAVMGPQAYGPPPALSRRMKMALAATAVGLFAAVATIAVLKGARAHL